MVIVVIAMLISILLPSLQRVRKQANDIGCQANLREWGVVINVAAAENDGEPAPCFENFYGPNPAGGANIWEYAHGRGTLSLCPAASRLAKGKVFLDEDGSTHWTHGSAFSAGWAASGDGSIVAAFSYAFNGSLVPQRTPEHPKTFVRWWSSVSRKGCPHASIPVIFDGLRGGETGAWSSESKLGPPPFEDYIGPSSPGSSWPYLCFNRHNGGVNYLFLDWSVRKVGVKELWTLKWDKDFDTAGPWTKAGGVKPEDWPQWMRRFKDY